jgi:streptogramin lyase
MLYDATVGKFFFGEQQDDRLGILDPNSMTVEEINLDLQGFTHTAPHDLHLGPDGKIYFSTLFDKIGRLDPNPGSLQAIQNSVEVFSVGFDPANPEASANKPDVLVTDPTNSNYIWFSQQHAGALGRFNITTKQIDNFVLPPFTTGLGHVVQPPDLFPHAVSQGADGHSLVFVVSGDSDPSFPSTIGNDVDRVYSLDLTNEANFTKTGIAGALNTSFGVFPTGSKPYNISDLAPDGNFYVLLIGTNQLGRLNPTTHAVQVLNTSATGEHIGELDELNLGADGHSIIFNEFFSDRIARFDTTTNQLTEYHIGISPRSNPLFATFGPDGNIWFTENYVNVGELGFRRNPVDGNLLHSDPNLPYVGGIGILNLTQAEQTRNNPNMGYVGSLYHDILHREPDAPGLAFWTNQLATGAMNRSQVAAGIDNSLESRILQIERIYMQLLSRPADRAGLNSSLTLLANGSSLSTIEEMVASSPEFIQKHGGGNPTLLLGALYGSFLMRPIDPAGLQSWSGALASGHSLFSVVQGIAESTERFQDLATLDYFSMLSRNPDPAGIASWTKILQQTKSTVRVDAGILSSDEYYHLHIFGFPPSFGP